MIHSNWLKYLKTYEEYSQLINNSSELERLSIQHQSLERKIQECNQLAIDELNKGIHSLQRGHGIKYSQQLKDDDRISVSVGSSISQVKSLKSGHSRRSFTTSNKSKAKAAARSAELAKLRLEQAERKAKVKQKQIQEQMEHDLQDLRDEVEYSQLEAQLLAADQMDESCSDSSGKRSSSSVKGNKAVLKKGLASSATRMGDLRDTCHSSTPHEQIKLLPKPVKPDDKHDFVPPSMKIKDDKLSLPEVSSGGENTHQDLTATLLEINQGLVSAVRQGAETTTVMKAMLQ